jgi:heat shock protein HslJ
MRLLLTSLALTAGLSMSACQSSTSADDGAAEPAPQASPIGAWTVASIEGTSVVADSPAVLEFTAEGRLAGNASVNRIMASYTLDGDTLTMSEVASTMMAGPEPLMKQEQRLIAALARVRAAEVVEGTLVLRDMEGVELVRARRSP